MKRVALTLACLLVATRAAAAHIAVVYVNKDNRCPGAGTSINPYCSIQTALKVALPGFDIRIRKASTPYNESDSAITSGTATYPIVLEADDPSNPPILSGSSAQITLNAVNYWTVQNLVFDGTGVSVPATALQLRGASWTAPSDTVGNKVLNSTFKNWGAGNTPGGGYFQFSGVVIQGGWAPTSPFSSTISGTVVQGNTFDGIVGIGLSVTSAKNTVVQNNEFKNLACSTQNAGNGSTAVVTDGVHEISGTAGWVSNTLYSHNTFHDFQAPRSCPFTRSAGGYTEMAAVHCDVYSNNGILNSNTISNLDPTNAGSEAIALFVEAGCHGWTVKNNIVHDVGWSAGRNQPNSTGAVNQWFNNTFYNIGVFGLELRAGSDVTVENNIIDNAGVSQLYVNGVHSSSGDYNLYWDLAGGNKVGQLNGGGTLNFSSWKAACNCDSHSINANPQFVSTTTADGLRLQSTSPAIDAGIALSAVPVDYDDLTRPQSRTYDMGAYEYH
jgi:hypothetical protein